jgi:hypothetical protein
VADAKEFGIAKSFDADNDREWKIDKTALRDAINAACKEKKLWRDKPEFPGKAKSGITTRRMGRDKIAVWRERQ